MIKKNILILLYEIDGWDYRNVFDAREINEANELCREAAIN
jgi:hypothetical protein